ncbi:alpha/beta fold hydrolase [Herbiconiux daphne]|uniref:Alpha/beta hydrolase n=1 Tax=Herbiconiux daphne TaxID=2970914 RepID=A0ABT2GXU2_9MICO|nr:alpha/beta hydrolase [Herbiconiux daphne]MCS5732786.1 alpha/beta hydrolase [Herbiconiux daphne]
MPYITITDGTRIYYTDQGEGRPVLLSHGWPLSSDAWAREIKLIADAGYRAIAHDRRGHGRSSKTYAGNDLDTHVGDLRELVLTLDLTDLTLIGHGAGAGEVVRYAARHGQGRVVSIITVGGVAPLLLQTVTNPDGVPLDALDAMREAVLENASQYWIDLAGPFFGGDRRGATVTRGDSDDLWRQGQNLNLAAAYDGIRAFSETDLTDDLRALEVPVLLAHGADDRIVPSAATSEIAITLLAQGTLTIYPDAPHGIVGAYRRALDDDIIAFLSS